MDLLAISPVTKTVPLGCGAVQVTGLSLRKLTGLMVAYPELVPLAAGGEVNLAKLLVEAPESALTIFSLGLVGAGRQRWRLLFWRKAQAEILDDAKLLAAFDQATAGQQIDCLGAIINLTFKGERAIPFLKAVAAAMTKPRETETASIPPEATPSPSGASSASDIPLTPSGT